MEDLISPLLLSKVKLSSENTFKNMCFSRYNTLIITIITVLILWRFTNCVLFQFQMNMPVTCEEVRQSMLSYVMSTV